MIAGEDVDNNGMNNQYYRLPRWIVLILVISLFINVITYSRVGTLKQEIRDMQNNINNLNNSISSSVSNNVYRINEALKRDASIITEFKYEFGEYKDKKIDLLLNVKPKVYAKGDKLYFSYKLGNEKPALIEAQSTDNINFEAKINISIMDNIDLDLIIDSGVNRKTEKLESIYRPIDKYTNRVSAYPQGGSMTYDKAKSALVISYYAFELFDVEGETGKYTLEDVKLSIALNDREIDSMAISKVENSRYRIELKDYKIACKNGDTIDAYITAKDNNGLTYSVLVESWKLGENGYLGTSNKSDKMMIVEIK